MDYVRGYRTIFADPEWTSKAGVAGLLFMSAMCIPLLGQLVVYGWEVEAMRRDLRGEAGLPPFHFEMRLLTRYLELGVRHWLIQLAYTAPLVMVMMPFVLFIQFSMMGLVAQGEQPSLASGVGMLAAMGGFFVLWMVVVVLATVLTLYAQIRYAITDDLGRAFDFREVFAGARRIGGPILVGAIVTGFVAMALQMVGMMACFVGMFFAVPLGIVAGGYLRADLARLDASRGGLALPPTSVAATFA